MPQPSDNLAKFPIDLFVEVLDACGCEVYLLETFLDGMTRWGNGKETNPSFSGSSAVADTNKEGISLTDIRCILNKLDRAGHYDRIESEIRKRLI
jgi:hypothetical protein